MSEKEKTMVNSINIIIENDNEIIDLALKMNDIMIKNGVGVHYIGKIIFKKHCKKVNKYLKRKYLAIVVIMTLHEVGLIDSRNLSLKEGLIRALEKSEEAIKTGRISYF